MRVYTRIGDIFSLIINDNEKVIFQFISRDKSYLCSDVIRVFKKRFPIGYNTKINEVLDDEVWCYLHTFVSIGTTLGCWTKIGFSQQLGTLDVYFRDALDYGGAPFVDESEKWVVRKMNGEEVYYGKLPEKYHSLDIGLILDPNNVVAFLTGQYNYPRCK